MEQSQKMLRIDLGPSVRSLFGRVMFGMYVPGRGPPRPRVGWGGGGWVGGWGVV